MSTAIQQETRDTATTQALTDDIEAVAARLNATLAEGDPDEYPYQRGREDGIAWARDYATAGALRELVHNLKHGRYGASDVGPGEREPHWQGFVDGAEEVLDDAGPMPEVTFADEDLDDDRHQRGCEDGIEWACNYATAGELRDLVENYEPDGPGVDDPHWRGFVEGAGEVLDAAGPHLKGPIPHDYRYFLKWLLEVAP